MEEFNPTPELVQNSKEFKRLTEQTKKDLETLNAGFTTMHEKAFSDKIDLDDRIKFIGNAILCILLAHNHKGGYANDKAGILSLEMDFE